ncbi:MAG TPA: UTP--glucose-1-phosphate uridylyltransferase [Roseiflexaceae bacterium]|nr:UTP--glucose-1-phosphate uridylyltransferase [Roseiflexaceae bacterium]
MGDTTQQIAERFSLFAERMQGEGLPALVIDTFRHYYTLLATGDTGIIAEQAITPVDSLPALGELASYRDAGRRVVGKVAQLKLNGGLGTSMGLDGPKSLLTARDGLSFLEITLRQNAQFAAQHRVDAPLLLLNSFSTAADTRALLDRDPIALQHPPRLLMQHKIPKVVRETQLPADSPGEPDLAWCPPGHGEVYLVLALSGQLDALLEAGYEYLFMSNIDNLGATIDLALLGYMQQHQISFLIEVARRTENDRKGGHIARDVHGQLILREIAQCPERDMDAFQDIQRHRYFNTNNIWIHLPQLKATLAQHQNILKLPMIRNLKTLDPKQPDSPEVYQLETAMGAAIAIFSGAQAVCVTRERFVPVKLCADLLLLRSDRYMLDDNYQLQPICSEQPIALQLDPAFYRLINDFDARFPFGSPSLIDCTRLNVNGDVCFGEGVILRGTVQITNRTPQQHVIPAGTILADTHHQVA